MSEHDNEPSPTTQGLRLPEHTNTQVRVGDEIQSYDSDHTALVHVLWSAERGGITISDADALAEHIMRSKWMRAVRLHTSQHSKTNASRSTTP